MATDVTAYAKSLGYRGCKPVIVCDGIVASHRGQDWYLFCAKLRQNQKRQSF